MPVITIIIPFRNEGGYIFETLRGLREHCKDYHAIVINDASDDEYDYSALNTLSEVTYIYNEQPLGCAANRHHGASLANTDYILFLDAHMAIQKDILTPIINFLQNNFRSLVCLQSGTWEGEIPVNKVSPHYTTGCYIKFDSQNPLEAKWISHSQAPETPEIEIPCVMGAAYAINKKYFDYLHGFNGLTGYGVDEQLLSMKVWLEGGRCVLLSNICIGHLYRDKAPYTNPDKIILYNKMVTAYLTCPFLLEFFKFIDSELFEDFQKNITEDLEKEQRYLKDIFTRKVNYLFEINRPNWIKCKL